MKKTMKAILTTVCVMGVFSMGFILGVENYYVNKLAETREEHKVEIQELTMGYEEEIQELIAENVGLSTEMYYMEQEVYKLINGNEYDLTLRVNDETHTYKAVKDGWFMEKIHNVIK